MNFFKNVSDELWIGIIFILVGIWMVIMNINYAIIAGIFATIGLFFILIDQAKKIEKRTEEKKTSEKVVKKVEKKEKKN